MDNLIKVIEFTEYPGLRHCSISDDSGEEFYHTILNKAFKEAYEQNEKIVIDLDYTAGYAPSFLDEAFGNLVYDFGLNEVKKTLDIISVQEPDLREMIIEETYIQWQERRENNDKPKKTSEHEPWYRLHENKLIQIKN